MQKASYIHIILAIKAKVFLCWLVTLLWLGSIPIHAQEKMRFNFSKTPDKYIGISGSMQLWSRYTQLNPGSEVNGAAQSGLFDVSIRRYRLKLYGQLSKQSSFTIQLGENNVNYYTQYSKGISLLDAYFEYQPSPYFALGLGKSAWTGLSRYAAPATSSALEADISFSAAPFVNVYDHLLRKLGVYVKGQIGGFDYRLALSKPSSESKPELVKETYATFSRVLPEFQASGYLKYQFLEKESNKSPFSVGSYLGKKNILNVGVGTLYQPSTTWLKVGNDTVSYNAKVWAVDCFYETPTNGDGAITAYMAYFIYNLGPNFIRTIGPNNPASGGSEGVSFFNGRGNSAPVIGTGDVFYGQFAYMFPTKKGEKVPVLQPYASVHYGKIEALQSPVLVYGTGINYYLSGQKSKLTLGYQNRPVFNMEAETIREWERRYMMVLQYQFKFG